MRSLDPQLPCLIPYWPFKKCILPPPPQQNVFDYHDCCFLFPMPGTGWGQELGNRSRKGVWGGSRIFYKFKVKDSDFPPLFGVLGCVSKGWSFAVGHCLWSFV